MSAQSAIVLLLGALLLLFYYLPKLTPPLIISTVSSFLFMYMYTLHFDERNETQLHEDMQQFHVELNSLIQVDGNLATFQVKTLEENERVAVRLRIDSEEDQHLLKTTKVGEICHITGELISPSPSRNFHGFDYEEYLYLQRIHWTLSTTSTEMSCEERANLFSSDRIHEWRLYALSVIDERFSEHVSSVMTALLFGDRSFIGVDVLTAYQDLGIIHLLAISGLHVGIVSGMAYYVLKRSGITKERSAEMLLVLLPVYAVLAGGAPSVIRAVTMTMIVFAAIRMHWRALSVHNLSFAACVMLIVNPYYLFHIGFQLSFSLTFSIILSVHYMQQLRTKLLQSLFICVLTQLFSFPIIVYYFHTYSLWSLVLNIMYVPFVSVFLLPVLWGLFFVSFFSMPLMMFGDRVLEHVLQFIHHFFVSVQQWPTGWTAFGETSMPWVGLLLLLTTVMLILLVRRKRKLLVIVTVGYVSSLLYPLYSPYFSNETVITFIDVGQGDSILIELPRREGTMLIDAGGYLPIPIEDWERRKVAPDPGRQSVAPYLKARGIKTVDYVVASHADYDHVGGLFEIIEQFNVKTILYPHIELEGEVEQRLLTRALERGATVKLQARGDVIATSNANFQVLQPKKTTGTIDNKNDHSLVLFVEIGGLTWLFTGDLEEEGERQLIGEYPTLEVDVLKAGHHGSRTSSTDAFIEHIKPSVAVITAGEDNRFNHPHPDVVETFRRHNVQVVGTHENGAIRFIHDGHSWSVEVKKSSVH